MQPTNFTTNFDPYAPTYAIATATASAAATATASNTATAVTSAAATATAGSAATAADNTATRSESSREEMMVNIARTFLLKLKERPNVIGYVKVEDGLFYGLDASSPQETEAREKDEYFDRNGQGLMLYRDLSSYSGHWKDDMREGEGTMIYSDGSQYRGQWHNDQPDGLGHFKSERYEVEGIFENGAHPKNGYGSSLIPWKQRSMYIGEMNFDGNSWSGRGAIYVNTGEKMVRIYEGFVKDGFCEGYGKMIQHIITTDHVNGIAQYKFNGFVTGISRNNVTQPGWIAYRVISKQMTYQGSAIMPNHTFVEHGLGIKKVGNKVWVGEWSNGKLIKCEKHYDFSKLNMKEQVVADDYIANRISTFKDWAKVGITQYNQSATKNSDGSWTVVHNSNPQQNSSSAASVSTATAASAPQTSATAASAAATQATAVSSTDSKEPMTFAKFLRTL